MYYKENIQTSIKDILESYTYITVEKLREALKEECVIRESQIIQELYDVVSVNYNRSEEVEDMIQNMIVIKFFREITVHEYRMLLSYYRDELKDDAFFMKHNIMVDCPLPPGRIRHKITDFSLYTLENLNAVNMNDLLESPEKPTIILASSST